MTVFLVDDDAAVRDALALLIEQEGFAVQAFDGAQAFLRACGPEPRGCVIVDLQMPEMDGLQLQQEMLRRGLRLPIVFLSGRGDISSSVRAMKAGAIDFLTKPVCRRDLMKSLHGALDTHARMQAQVEANATAVSRFTSLTNREREVMALVIEGLGNKEIARRFRISYRTVELHRARILQKTGANSVLDLARLARAAGLGV